MSDKLDSIKKALSGKVGTSDAFTSAQEPLRKSLYPSSKLEPIGSLTHNVGDIRVIGSLTSDSLLGKSTSTHEYHPKRARKLDQQVLFMGGSVLSEGTKGSLTLDAQAIILPGLVASNIEEGDILWLTNSNVGGINLGTYKIDAWDVLTEALQIEGSFKEPAGGFLAASEQEYYWTVFRPEPVRLLPFPTEGDSGSETVFLTTLPSAWPIYPLGLGDSREDQVPVPYKATYVLDSAVRDGDQVVATISNTGTSNFSENDYVAFDDSGFYVVASSSVNGTEEEVVLTPSYDVEIPAVFGSSIHHLWAVADFLENPSAAPSGQKSIYNEDFLNTVRVRNLISPSDLGGTSRDFIRDPADGAPTRVQSQRNKFTDASYRTSRSSDIGYGLVLFPAKADGSPDLSKPIRNLDKVSISSVEEDQWIQVDYEEGVIRLSHVPEEGYDLNPASYLGADNRPRIYAAYAAYRGPSTGSSAQSLWSRIEGDAGAVRTSIHYGGSDPVEKNAWVIDLGDTSLLDSYPLSPDFLEAGGKRKKVSFASSPKSPEQRWQVRDESTFHLGSVGFGKVSDTDISDQFYFAPDAGSHGIDEAGSPFDLSALPDARILSGKPVLKTTFEEIVIDSSNKVISLSLDGVLLETTISENTYDPQGLRSAISMSIITDFFNPDPNEEALQELFNTVSHISYDNGVASLVISSEKTLEILPASINATLGWVTGKVKSKDIRLGFGYNKDLQSSLTHGQETQSLVWDGVDIRLGGFGSLRDSSLLSHASMGMGVLGVPSGDPDEAHEAFEILYDPISVSSTTLEFRKYGILKFNRHESNNIDSRNQNVRVFDDSEGVVSIDFTGRDEPAVYYIIYNAEIDDFQTLKVNEDLGNLDIGDLLDPMFEYHHVGVPLYVVNWENNEIQRCVDVRAFLTASSAGSGVSVGETLGRYKTLDGAITRANHCNLFGKLGAYASISLAEDITFYMNFARWDSGTRISSDITINGCGHSMTLDSIQGGLINQDRIFIIEEGTSCVFENLKIKNEVVTNATYFNLLVGSEDFTPYTINDTKSTVTLKNVQVEGNSSTQDRILITHRANHPYSNGGDLVMESCTLSEVVINHVIASPNTLDFDSRVKSPFTVRMRDCQLFNSQVDLEMARVEVDGLYATNEDNDGALIINTENCWGWIRNVKADIIKDFFCMDGELSSLHLDSIEIEHKGLDGNGSEAPNEALDLKKGHCQISKVHLRLSNLYPLEAGFEPLVGSTSPPYRYGETGWGIDSRGIRVRGSNVQLSDIYAEGYPPVNLFNIGTEPRRSRSISFVDLSENNTVSNVQFEDVQIHLPLIKMNSLEGLYDISLTGLEAPETWIGDSECIQVASSSSLFRLTVDGVSYALNTTFGDAAIPSNPTVAEIATEFTNQMDGAATFTAIERDTNDYRLKITAPASNFDSHIIIGHSSVNAPLKFRTGAEVRPNRGSNVSSTPWTGPLVTDLGSTGSNPFTYTITGSQFLSARQDEIEVRVFDGNNDDAYVKSVILTPNTATTWTDTEISFSSATNPLANPEVLISSGQFVGSFALKSNDRWACYKFFAF